MSTKAIKIGVTAAVLVTALTWLLYASLSEGTEYYRHVDEVMADGPSWYGKPLQLHGYVVDRSILRKPDTLEYRFEVQSNGKTVPVRYTGIVPDTFKSGAEVVLKGRLGADGFSVDPNGVMAKCPSKYEASRTPGAPGS
jgi:cytochrome c-type biogenesis protein CcmE